MAMDLRKVLDTLRAAVQEEERLQAKEGSLLSVRPKEFISDVVAPQFGKMVERLREVQETGVHYHLSAAGCHLLAVAHDDHLPPWFDDVCMQLTYRRTWFAAGHLTIASGEVIRQLPGAERVGLASAAACVLLDPTVDHVAGGEGPHPQGALQILGQALRQREREEGARDR
jgi:hypothetical protein